MFFNSIKLSNKDSILVLQTAAGFLDDGNTLLKSFEYTAEIFKNKFSTQHITKTLRALIDDVNDNGIPMQDSLIEYGVLSVEEAAMFAEKSTNARESIEGIIKLREFGSQYENILMKTYRTTILIILATSAALWYYAKEIEDKLKEITLSFAQGNVTSDMFDYIPYYVTHKSVHIYIALGTIIFVSLVLFLYSYFYKNNRKVIYKIFYKKAYDDIPKMFYLMTGIKKGGRGTTVQIFDKMRYIEDYKGLTRMFNELHDAVYTREPYYEIFSRYGFPDDIVIKIQSREQTNFWDGMDSIIDFSKARAIEEYTALEKRMQAISMFLWMLYPSYYLFHLSYIFSIAGSNNGALGF